MSDFWNSVRLCIHDYCGELPQKSSALPKMHNTNIFQQFVFSSFFAICSQLSIHIKRQGLVVERKLGSEDTFKGPDVAILLLLQALHSLAIKG